MTSITSIEHLSNEIFHEIFDNLHGIDIYEAFSNLNYRSQQLLNSSSLLFKIKLRHSTSDETFIENYKQIHLLHNQYQISAVDIWLSSLNKQFFISFPIDSSFDHLQSLLVQPLPSNILISFLTNLTSLPRLISLTIGIENDFKNLNDIYRLMFALPTLKYNKFSLSGGDSSISLPMASNKQLSTIEHLVISHSCKFNELSTLLSYTPQLRRLTFTDMYDNDINIGLLLPITLLNLTRLSIHANSLTFDDFEIFIKKIYSKLHVLRVTIQSGDIAYRNVVRWEKLILEYLPQLEKFYFDYYACFEDDENPSKYVGQSNQFSSSFWIERRWIFENKIRVGQIIYSIRPDKKRWYDYAQHEMFNSSIELAKSARLELTSICLNNFLGFIADMDLALTGTDIYHLEIADRKIYTDVLIDIVCSLPKLVSLKINSLPLSERGNLCNEERDKFLWISNRNQTTKVYLGKTNSIEEIDFLMKLCPRMNYLQLNFIFYINMELFIKDILIKVNKDCNQYLRLLCIRIPTADDKMIIELQKMINVNKLLVDYKIKRAGDNIYLQW